MPLQRSGVRAGGAQHVTVWAPSSHEVRLPLSVLYPVAVARYWFGAPSTPLGRLAPPWVLRSFGDRVSPRILEGVIRSQAFRLFRASEAEHHASLAAACRWYLRRSGNRASQLELAIRSPDGTSLEVLVPYSAISPESPFLVDQCSNAAPTDDDGFAWPAAFPPSGFLALLTGFSSLGLVGLFRPTSAHGVRALQSLSLTGSRDASSASSTLLTLVVAPLPVRRSSSGSCSTRESVGDVQCFHRWAASMLS